MEKSLILVADAHRARCFERAAGGAELTELASFVFAQERHSQPPEKGDVSGDAGKGHGRIAQSQKQFEPQTDAHALERHRFARDLLDYLNAAVADKRCTSLSLIASGPMLGELRAGLSPAAQQVLTACVTRDLTRYQGRDLQERIDAALAPST